MSYIDLHTHLNLAAFADDYNDVAKRAYEAGVSMINVGTMYATSKRTVELAHELNTEVTHEQYVFATVGLHPVHTSASYHDTEELGGEGKAFTSKGEVLDYDAYKELAQDKYVLAIGECGLDYYRVLDKEAHKKQIESFEQQIALANELNKPLMLHIRSGEAGNAYQDALGILKRHAKVSGNSHFFAGSLEDAKGFWDMGYSTSFTGVLTFTSDYDELVKAVPKDLIHAETDAPYVAPKPHRGSRNEPAYVVEVVKRMAELRGVREEEWAAQLWSNAAAMFGVQ
jgi:TatD DNase family protein